MIALTALRNNCNSSFTKARNTVDEDMASKSNWFGTAEGIYSMKIINDSVHGHIELPKLCVKIIDTVQFQRLRDIKQLGSSYYVYPGASHNRFEHSIGVCYLAGEYVRHLQRQQPELEISEKDILCLQIAGLCHDLGHGPFSHLWERFLDRIDPETFGEWRHEKMSVKMFEHIIEKNNLTETFNQLGLIEDDRKFIKQLIWRDENEQMCRLDKSYLYEIVNNKETGIDVDKWDYLLRDGLHLNIKTSFDCHRVMKFSRVNTVDGKQHITYRDKEIENLFEMFMIREKLHRKAYQHRVSKIIEEMIIESLIEANKSVKITLDDGTKCSFTEASRNVEAYNKMSDFLFYNILYGERSPARELLECIQKRQFYSYIGKIKINGGKKTNEKEIQQSIQDFCDEEKKQSDVVVSSCSFNYGKKDENPLFCAYFFNKENVDNAVSKTIKDVSCTLPQRYEEKVMFIYSKSHENSRVEKIKTALKLWANEKKITLDNTSG